MSFKAEVIADGSGKFCGNGLRFATEHEAGHYVGDLAMRWTSVRETRVVASEDDVNARIVNNKLEHAPWGPACPKCGKNDTQRGHHNPSALAPECDYWVCNDCEHQWGHE